MADGKKKRAIRFEEKIKSFLERLEFDDVDGAKDSFQINGIQVDVVGGHEDTLLIIECTMKQKLGRKSVRDKIKEIRGVADALEKGFKKHPIYGKYKYFRYVLATKNIIIRHEDIVFANNSKPRIYIWDDNFIAYYEDLYDKIKLYAKFNLLGEMGIRPTRQNTISVPAFQTKFGKIKIYSFLINPCDLLEVSYVARRETKNERFYQRIVKKDRIKKIAKYVNEGNILPNNLIIAFGDHIRKYIKFHVIQKDYIGKCTSGFGVSYGILEFPRDYRSCWIIDGQHRLYSFINNTDKFFVMPVTAFENLDLEAQCKIFLDINKNQKPVPPDLVWDLNGNMIPTEEDGIISNTVKTLNEKGPLYHRIYIPSKGIRRRKKLLRMAGMCLSIKRMRLVKETTASRTENPFYVSDENKEKKANKIVKKLSNALNEYFTCVQKIMKDDWELEDKGFVLDDGGNSVMIRLFEKIVSRCVSKGVPTKEDYKKYLKPPSKLFSERYKDKDELKKLKLRITSEGGKDELLKELVIYIRQETGDELFGGEIESEVIKKIRKLEKDLKELVRKVLEKHFGERWFEEKVPDDIRKRAIKNMKKHNTEDYNKAYLQMTFGECISTIKQNKSLFYPIFQHGEYGFGSNRELEGAFDLISRLRTQEAHHVPMKKRTYDERLFEIYVEKINKCLKPIIS